MWSVLFQLIDGRSGRKETVTFKNFESTFPRYNVTLSDFDSCQNAFLATLRRRSWVSCSDLPLEQSAPSGEDTVTEEFTQSHQSEINRKINANDKQSGEDTVTEECTESHQSENDNLGKNLTNMPEDYRMQSMDEETAAFMTAKRWFLPLQSRIEKQKNYRERVSKDIETKQQKRMEILQTWIESDHELEAANSEQARAKHEMAILVAEQTAESAKAVNQGISVDQIHTTGSTADQAAQQTILPVFKSVLSRLSTECHSVLEQLMAAGATGEDVKKISQIMAQTVRQQETGSMRPEPGLEAQSLPYEVVGSDEEFSTGECVPGCSKNGHRGPRSHQEEPVRRVHRKETFGEEM